MGRQRQVLDAVHRYIDVPVELDSVLDSPAVQRLRRISQTALASMVYPSANGTRFEHALGAMHLARLAFNHAWRNSPERAREQLRVCAARDFPGLLPQASGEVREIFATAVAGVGLLHDIGHPPFSHALEGYFEERAGTIFADSPTFQRTLRSKRAKPFHELAGEVMLNDLEDYFPDQDKFALLREIYLADPDEKGWKSALHAIVSSRVDIDRLDYIMRDSYHAGTEYGAVDSSRLLGALEFRVTTDHDVRLAVGLRARSAAELLLVQRMQAFRWVYQHPRVVAAESLLRRALDELHEVSQTGSEAPSTWAAEAIRKLYPQLNFVRPSSSYRIAGIAFEVTPSDAPESGGSDVQVQLPLEVTVNGDTSDPSKELFGEVQMSVTDDAIHKYCSASAICARAAKIAGEQPDPRLDRFLHYYGASLRRSSDLVVLWKRHEEYAAVASDIAQHEVVAAFVSAFRTSGHDEARRIGGAGGDLYASCVDDVASDPIRLINYLGYRLLHRESRRLSAFLTEEVPPIGGRQGFWQIAFTARRDPLHSLVPNVELEGDVGLTVSLQSTSPLVASVDAMESRSVKLHAFFVVTDRRGEMPRSQHRRRLRAAFASRLPVFLKNHFDEAIFGAKNSLMQLADFKGILDRAGGSSHG